MSRSPNHAGGSTATSPLRARRSRGDAALQPRGGARSWSTFTGLIGTSVETEVASALDCRTSTIRTASPAAGTRARFLLETMPTVRRILARHAADDPKRRSSAPSTTLASNDTTSQRSSAPWSGALHGCATAAAVGDELWDERTRDDDGQVFPELIDRALAHRGNASAS